MEKGFSDLIYCGYVTFTLFFKFVLLTLKQSYDGSTGSEKDMKDMCENNQVAVSIRKTVLPGMAIPMLKIRRPNGRLIFNMEIAIRR